MSMIVIIILTNYSQFFSYDSEDNRRLRSVLLTVDKPRWRG